MRLTLEGKVTLVSPEHLEKVPSPMLVTLGGMVTLVSPSQLLKAPLPMLVTPDGMVTLVSLAHPAKAPSPMLVTGLPSIYDAMVTAPVANFQLVMEMEVPLSLYSKLP